MSYSRAATFNGKSDIPFRHDMVSYYDDRQPFYVEDENGRKYVGSDSLARVKQEFLTLLLSDEESESEWDGYAAVNWLKVAQAIGLNAFESKVFVFRYQIGKCREDLFDMAQSDQELRLKYQAAWKAIDRSQAEIQRVIKKDWRMSGHYLQTAPPTRRAVIPMPERIKDNDSEVLRNLDERFSSPPKGLGWGQNLRSGRRF